MNKTPLYIAYILFTLTSFSQNLECCETIEAVKATLSGKWKRNKSKHQLIYNYEFEGRYYGRLETYKQPLDPNIVKVIVSCEPHVDVLKTKEEFKLEYTYMSRTSISKIKFLDNTKLILENEGIITEYRKLKD